MKVKQLWILYAVVVAVGYAIMTAATVFTPPIQAFDSDFSQPAVFVPTPIPVVGRWWRCKIFPPGKQSR